MKNFLDSLDKFVYKNKKYIIICWIIVFVLSVPFAIKLFSVVSYSITSSPSNSNSSSNSTDNTQIILILNKNVLSSSSESFVNKLSANITNSNITSIFSIDQELLYRVYYLINAYSQTTLSALYNEFNVSPATVSPVLNETIIRLASAHLSALAVNMSAEYNFETGGSLNNFTYGILKGYVNSSPSYIVNKYNVSNFPVFASRQVSLGFVNPNKTAMIIIVQNANYSSVENSVGKLASNYNSTAYVSGASAIANGIESSTLIGTFLAIAVGVMIAILVTGLIFRSPVAAFVPLLIFGIDLSVAYSIFYLVFSRILNTQISFFDPTLTSILMLGLSTDYLVYILYRYRQERGAGIKQKKSTYLAMRWSGEAVFFSGITVISSYVLLYILNLAFVSSSGLTNAVGIMIVVLSALTLLPAMLYTFGDKLMFPNKYKMKTDGLGIFHKIAEFDNKNAVPIIIIFAIIAMISIYFFFTFMPDFNLLGLIPNSQATQTLLTAPSKFGYDPINSMLVTIYPGAYSAQNIVQGINNTPGVYTAIYNKALNGTTYVNVFFTNNGFSRGALTTYSSINNLLTKSGVSYNMTGLPAFVGQSFYSIYNQIPLMILVLGIVIFVILFILLIAFYTPLRLVLMLISILSIANAITVFIFYFVYSLPFIVIAQIFLITNIMGVGIDYDIFLVLRIRENVKRGMKNEIAVKRGLEKSGPVIISIGLILAAVFFAIASSGIPLLAEVGFIVGIGIITDTFISVLFIIPSMMMILSKYNWWPSKIRKKL